jgi:hypothetical protein
MSPVYSRVLGVLLVVLAVTGCGGSDDEPRKVAEEAGLTTYEVASSGFSIGVPSDWRAVSADEALDEETLDAIREADPELGPFIDQIGAADSPIKLVAVDPDVENGFATNLNVVVSELPSGATREDYFTSLAPQLEELGVTEFTEDLVDLPAGEAQHVTYEHQRAGADQPLAVVHYVLVEEGVGYTLTYTTPAAGLEDRLAEFERSAGSFRIG